MMAGGPVLFQDHRIDQIRSHCMKSRFAQVQNQAGPRLLAGLLIGLLLGTTALAAEPPPVAVEAQLVRASMVAREVTAVGTVRANEAITLTAEVAGRIDEINFSEGTRVS